MDILLVVNGNCVFNFLQWAEERKVKVFQKGERVVCGSKGVCVVEEITTLDIAGVDKKREYYILKPLYLSSSTVYIPVDTAEGSMRKVLAHEEAENLIHRIPEIPLITIANDKLLEQEYKNCLKTSSCQDLIRIIKTIYLRKRARAEAGRKETAVDGCQIFSDRRGPVVRRAGGGTGYVQRKCGKLYKYLFTIRVKRSMIST